MRLFSFPTFLLFLATGAMALAQNSTGGIGGTVHDPSGANIPGARVRVSNQETGFSRAAETNDLGEFNFSALPVGTYSVDVEKEGFRHEVQKDMKVDILQVRKVPFTMELGTVSDTVSVDTKALLLDTETSEAGQIINREQVSKLPLNVRQFMQLAYLAPMATPATNDFNSNEINRGTSVPSGAGARPENNNYQIDGIDNREDGRNSFAVSPPVDSIAEFRVQTGTASAEFGRGGGIIINVATRSGTNDYHGSLYEFLRNDKLDARPFFSSRKNPLKRNQFGAALGGPIQRDKLFFFTNYEGYREASTGNPPVGQVLTDAQRNGVFSTRITDPAAGGAAFPNNTIPASRISPISRYILTLVPLPNNPGNPARNFIYNAVPSGHTVRDSGVGRVDYIASEKDTFYARYLINNEQAAPRPAFPLLPIPEAPV